MGKRTENTPKARNEELHVRRYGVRAHRGKAENPGISRCPVVGINKLAAESAPSLNYLASQATGGLPTGEFFTYDYNRELGGNFQQIGGIAGELASPMLYGKAVQLAGRAVYLGIEYGFDAKYGASLNVGLNPFANDISVGTRGGVSRAKYVFWK